MIDQDDDDFFDNAPATKTDRDLGPVFTADYGSECSETGDWITEGDDIRADGHGSFAHATCIRQNARPVIWE